MLLRSALRCVLVQRPVVHYDVDLLSADVVGRVTDSALPWASPPPLPFRSARAWSPPTLPSPSPQGDVGEAASPAPHAACSYCLLAAIEQSVLTPVAVAGPPTAAER